MIMSPDEICKKFPELDEILLVSESRFESSRRTYFYKDKIIKSRKWNGHTEPIDRQNNFKEEFEILRLCEGIKGVPQGLHYCNNGGYELLLMNFVEGIQLSNIKLNFKILINVVNQLYKILINLSEKGICHNDMVPGNILIKPDMSVSLIDFDQAILTTPFKAFAGNFLGIKIGDSKVNYSFSTVIKQYIKSKFPNLIVKTKKLLGTGYDKEFMELPEIKSDSPPELSDLVNAWKIAQESNASAPGVIIAYYALDYKGYYFPGERSWSDRWEVLQNISDYSGKTIVELGCNMGLLSTFLLKDKNAKKCVGVDLDKKILKSAELISNVFKVKPEYMQMDFDSNQDWENKLLAHKPDIVFALNVLNWVKDKERFLSFLSKVPEVIFEGHDLPEIEKKRFSNLGFIDIKEIGFSERKRIILRCRK